MHLLWETSEWPGGRVDQPITWLSWVALDQQSNEGYLGAGSQQGTVGITLTCSKPGASTFPPSSGLFERATLNQADDTVNRGKQADGASDSGRNIAANRRLNYNLRGHRSPVRIVEWNSLHRKLASCDEGGICYVWMCHEDRWSVELVNDRGVRIRDFSWSPTGDLALICYSDSFVLVGSAQGQRIWSTNLDQDTTVLCGAWLPDEHGVVLGTKLGELILMNNEGGMVGRYMIWRDTAIQKLAWSAVRSSDSQSTLCACFGNGAIYFLRGCDDADPVMCHSDMEIVRAQWSSDAEHLAVVGVSQKDRSNKLLIYSGVGTLVLSTTIPCQTAEKQVTAFSWGYNDTRLFVAVENELFVGQVYGHVPRLCLLSAHKVWSCVENVTHVTQLPISQVEKRMVESQSHHTVQCHVPDVDSLVSYVCCPTTCRWYCTIIPEPQLATHLTATFTLCVEHLGGHVPVLRGRQINRFRPEFDIKLFRNDEDSPRKLWVADEISCNRQGSEPPDETAEDERNRHSSGGRAPIGIASPFGRSRTHSCSDVFVYDARANSSSTTDPKKRFSSTPPRPPQANSSTLAPEALDTSHPPSGSSPSSAVLATPSRHQPEASCFVRGTAATRSVGGMVPNAGPVSFGRDSVWRRSKRQIRQIVHRAHVQFSQRQKERKLVQVTSNLWCTRFKLLGLDDSFLPPYLGQVVYKTSVLHLQPRQMSVQLVDLRNYSQGNPHVPIPQDNEPGQSEQEDMLFESMVMRADNNLLPRLMDEGPPVAPLPAELFGGPPAFADLGQMGEVVGYGFNNGGRSATNMLGSDQGDLGIMNFSDSRIDGAVGVTNSAAVQAEERLMSHVVKEFDDLKLAVERHIQRMRVFASNLQQSSQPLAEFGVGSSELGGVVGPSVHQRLQQHATQLTPPSFLPSSIGQVARDSSSSTSSLAGSNYESLNLFSDKASKYVVEKSPIIEGIISDKQPITSRIEKPNEIVEVCKLDNSKIEHSISAYNTESQDAGLIDHKPRVVSKTNSENKFCRFKDFEPGCSSPSSCKITQSTDQSNAKHAAVANRGNPSDLPESPSTNEESEKKLSTSSAGGASKSPISGCFPKASQQSTESLQEVKSSNYGLVAPRHPMIRASKSTSSSRSTKTDGPGIPTSSKRRSKRENLRRFNFACIRGANTTSSDDNSSLVDPNGHVAVDDVRSACPEELLNSGTQKSFSANARLKKKKSFFKSPKTSFGHDSSPVHESPGSRTPAEMHSVDINRALLKNTFEENHGGASSAEKKRSSFRKLFSLNSNNCVTSDPVAPITSFVVPAPARTPCSATLLLSNGSKKSHSSDHVAWNATIDEFSFIDEDADATDGEPDELIYGKGGKMTHLIHRRVASYSSPTWEADRPHSSGEVVLSASDSKTANLPSASIPGRSEIHTVNSESGKSTDCLYIEQGTTGQTLKDNEVGKLSVSTDADELLDRPESTSKSLSGGGQSGQVIPQLSVVEKSLANEESSVIVETEHNDVCMDSKMEVIISEREVVDAVISSGLGVEPVAPPNIDNLPACVTDPNNNPAPLLATTGGGATFGCNAAPSGFSKFQHNNLSTPVRTRNKQLKDVASVLDKLYKLAGELAPWRPGSANNTHPIGSSGFPESCSTSSKITPYSYGLTNRANEFLPADDLSLRLADLSYRINQLESRIVFGNDMLEDIRKDLHQRVQRIRRTITSRAGTEPLNEETVESLYYGNLDAIDESSPSPAFLASQRPASGFHDRVDHPSSTTLHARLPPTGQSTSPHSTPATIHGPLSPSPTATNLAEEPAELLVLHNKAPFWNDASQVYQLDFGGRVTQESAKNFQIEFQGKQVMQFGRIESNAYTLDFQAPFTAVQAFAVALASITQRLK